MNAIENEIVSKRNVERLYFPAEPQYCRFFVKKYQKRTPLSNRLYYLRMHLVDATIQQFLTRPSGKRKVIVNLGCGSDPLPWRILLRHNELCSGVLFVDVDSPGIMVPKREVVRRTPELMAPFTSLDFPEKSHIILRSDQYCQISCNPHDLSEIERAILPVTDIKNSEFLFIVETGLTEDVGATDALIRWAGAVADAEFCLIENIIPDGTSTSFAHAMLQHLANANVPTNGLERYPTIDSQRNRFEELGWVETMAQSLWTAWSDLRHLSPSQRQALDLVEPFDDWEEFAYFTSHSCILLARTAALKANASSLKTHAREPSLECFPTTEINMVFSPTADLKNISPRRFGAPLLVETVWGQKVVANIFGQGASGNLRSCDFYSNNTDADSSPQVSLSQGGPGARSHFTLTDLGDYGYLLVGGKGPTNIPFHDCWVFKKDVNQWVETHGLPMPLFRHTAVRLGYSKLVLLAGGRSDFTASHPNFLVFHPAAGWVRCTVKGSQKPPALTGCLLIFTADKKQNASTFCGILSGGMTADGTVSQDILKWSLDISKSTEPTITFELTRSNPQWPSQLLSRYGATSTRVGDAVIVSGGIYASGTVPARQEIMRFRACVGNSELPECLDYTQSLEPEVSPPFFTGSSVVMINGTEAVIMGGGMTSFPTETGWSQGIYTLSIATSSSPGDLAQKQTALRYLKTMAVTNEASTISREPGSADTRPLAISPIPRIGLSSDEQFQSILQSGRPVIFEKLELGRCLTRWRLAYLAEQVGHERKIVTHESTNQAMDFLSKNFRYKTQTFQEFVREVDEGKKLYLRALSADKPSDSPANLDTDFPTISKDFLLPSQLQFVKDKLFSSVLRISGPVNMWLHYDVLANIYCQIQGTKRFYLFPPSDVTQLGFAPGTSSSSIDAFAAMASSSLPPHCHPYETTLGPGDVLFIPQLWLHTATPVSNSSIAVNVFFRDLEKGYSSGRDVYGNRDLAAYEKARQDVARISGTFKNLPRDTKQFYLRRLADELLQHSTQ